MTATREQAMVALFNTLKSATMADNVTPAFKLASRRIKLWGDVPAQQQPALFLIETHETRMQQPPQGMPSKLLMKASAVVYTSTPDTGIPSTAMNLALDSIERALKPDDLSRNVFTLGGIVYRCWVEGNIIKTPGDLDGQGMAIVPILMLLP